MPQPSSSYAGDATPQEAWEALAGDPSAALVDVRTSAEWAFVGIPDLSELSKRPVLAEWQTYPSMQVDQGFVDRVAEALQATGSGPETPVYFLCRSGVRSQAAAAAMAAKGFTACFNVAGGFEGPLDAQRHRGASAGWKAVGLPWTQS
jgi:rhodanese-related sulfurtransferase